MFRKKKTKFVIIKDLKIVTIITKRVRENENKKEK